jgi:glycosyltransferase involved in cell wall biosynthesis
MTSRAIQIVPGPAEQQQPPGARSLGGSRFTGAARPVVCHFTTAHTTLKSRSFHRECVPLAEAGFQISYISPASIDADAEGIRFERMAKPASFPGRAFGRIRLLRTLLREHADVYHFQDPQLLPLGMLLKVAFRKRVIYDAYEDFPSMAAHKTALPAALRPLAATLIAGAEWLGAHCFDAIMTADPLTMRRMARVGHSRKLVFYNFPNLEFFPTPLKQKKRFDLVYRGGLSERTGTFLLLDALQRLAGEGRRVRLLLIGYCDSVESERRLRGHIAAYRLAEQVEMRGRIPHEEMAAVLGEARIGVSPLMDVPKFRLNIPVKIFEYWASGLPVIASDLPPSRPFTRGSGAVISFPAGDAEALAGAIACLLDHPEEAKEMGRRGREIVERRLNNRREARKLVLLFHSLLPESGTAVTTEYDNA